MFSLLPKRLDKHFIDRGNVSCPSCEHDVEADQCAGCRWMLEFNASAKLPFVRCRPPARALIPQV